MAILVGAWGLLRQLEGNLNDPAKSVVMYLSEFTTQSNLIALGVLVYGVLLARRGDEPTARAERVRGAAVTYLTLTAIVFYFLVAGTRAEPGEHHYSDLASHVLHRVMPAFMVLDWLVLPPRRKVPVRSALWWPVYPLLYCAYSLIRGEVAHWYPYDFLDPREPGGWSGVLLYVVGICVGFLVFSQLVVWLGNTARHLWGHHGDGVQAATAG
jgi:hypothetical protein